MNNPFYTDSDRAGLTDGGIADETAPFWAVVEIYGHTKLAGLVSEITIAGRAFVNIAVPKTSSWSAFNRQVAPTAVFSFQPVDQAVAELLAERWQVAPIAEYDAKAIYNDVVGQVRAEYETRLQELTQMYARQLESAGLAVRQEQKQIPGTRSDDDLMVFED